MSKEDKDRFNFLCAIFLDYELISPSMRKILVFGQTLIGSIRIGIKVL